MRRNIVILFTLLCTTMTLLSGCRSTEIDSVENCGDILLSISTDSQAAAVEVKATAEPVLQYSLSVQDLYGTEVEYYENVAFVDNLKIMAGSYNFVIEYGRDTSQVRIDQPYYYGKTQVEVVAAKTNYVPLVGKLKNARVSAEFSEVIKDKRVFSDYTFEMDSVVLSRDDIERGSSLYITADRERIYPWTMTLTNVQGLKSEISGVLSGVTSCSHYTFSFDVDVEMSEDEGIVGFDILVDDEVKVETDQIEINLEQRPAPSYTGIGYTVGEIKTFQDQESRNETLKVAINAGEGLREVTLRHLSTELFEAGLPYTIKLSEVTADLREIIRGIGIDWDGVIEANRDLIIDFSEYANSCKLGQYSLYITAQDRVQQKTETSLLFMVVDETDHLPLNATAAAKYAVLNGQWSTDEVPEGLGFQYRKVGESQWITTEANDTQITSQTNKTYSVRIVNLSASSKYEFRSYSTVSQYARTVEFTTEAAPEITNLNFDSGYYDGDTWYPNASGGNSYWGTGNEGVCDWPLSMSSITNHTDDAISGKAVKMTSTKISYALSPVKFAAGNIFLGSYSTDMSNPKNSVSLGRPYTGKPLGLRGWFKYTPKNINNDKDDVAGPAYGQPDKAHIYFSLENWGGATSRPSNPVVIAYGEFMTNQSSTTYSQFSFNLEYYSTSTPTHAVLAATSSYLGEDFCGGEGSTLYIDNFELIWY